MTETIPQGPIYSTFASDPDFEELLEMFVDTISERCKQLEQHYHAGELDMVCHTAHQLKGAGGGYGFDGLSQAASRLEQACKSEDQDRLSKLFDELVAYLNRIRV